MEYRMLYDILMARIAGTGINLETKGSFLTPHNIKILGIKGFVTAFVHDLYNEILNYCPPKSKFYTIDSLIPAIHNLCYLFNVPLSKFDDQYLNTTNDGEMWFKLDQDQKFSIILNLFFTLFEDLREDDSQSEFLPIGSPPQFKKADFCFVFRAREYVKLAN